MTSNSGNSARSQLIKTRRGTWIDKDLLPAARQECLEALQRASEVVGEDVIKMVRGDRQYREEDSSLDESYWSVGHRALVWHGLSTLFVEAVQYLLQEELEASSLAHEASKSAEMCGCCGRELSAHEPAYFGAKVYVGMWPLSPTISRKRQDGRQGAHPRTIRKLAEALGVAPSELTRRKGDRDGEEARQQ